MDGSLLRDSAPGAWRSAVLLLLLGALLSACSRGVRLQDVLGYAPDGEQVVARGEGRSLQLFALPSRAALWTASVPGPPDVAGISVRFSNDGRYFVLVETGYGGFPPGRYAVWERATGRKTSPYFPIAAQFTPPAGTQRVAVSDDGRWLASTLEPEAGRTQRTLRVYDAPSGRLVHARPDSASPVSFAPGAPLLAARGTILEPSGNGFREVARFDDALESVWADQRLAMLTPTGVRVWERGGARVLPFHFGFERSPRKLTPHNGGLAAAKNLLAVFEAPPEAVKADPLLEVYDLARGTLLFSRRGLGRFSDIEFRDGTVIALVEREWLAFVVVLDLSSGRVLRERSLGAFGYGKYRVSPERIYFWPFLLPGGKFVAREHAGRYEFSSTDD